jgi:hypothetical protein
MNKRLVLLFIGGLLLAACGGNTAVSTPSGLNDTYENALSVQGQLALGTIQLAENDLAVDETQAAVLLPLWQALQSLSASDTTAAVEINAVVNQIQDGMASEQIQAITAMSLTTDDIATLMQDGLAGNMGDVSSGQNNDSSSSVMTGPAGGEPPAGGDFAGGDPGGTPPDMGGIAGAGASSSEETDARPINGGLGEMQETMLTNAVISFLAEKTSSVVDN